MKLRALGRLLRLSLFPSALADVLAGALLAAGAWPPLAELGLLFAAALGLYQGGMVLNDWADRREDARLRSERPLPSGAVSAPLALGLGLFLLAAGVAAAFRIDSRPGLLAAGVALVVLFYDLGPRGPLLGPLLLAAARAGNVSLGILLGLAGGTGRGLPGAALVAAALGYGVYVFVVSRLGRLEDARTPPAAGRTRRLLAGLAALLVLVPTVTLCCAWPAGLAGRHALGAAVALALSLWAAGGLWRASRTDPRAPREVLRAMGLALRRLLILTASLAALPGTAAACLASACILAGYPLSHALRRVFPPS